MLAHGAAENFDERRVEGGARLLLDLFEGFGDGDGSGTGPVGGEIVEGLSERDDLCRERDLLFFQTERIACAIPSLVMEGDNLNGFGGKAYGLCDTGAEVRAMKGAAVVSR